MCLGGVPLFILSLCFIEIFFFQQHCFFNSLRLIRINSEMFLIGHYHGNICLVVVLVTWGPGTNTYTVNYLT